MTRGRKVVIVVLALLLVGCISGYRTFHPASMRVLEASLQDAYPDLRFESKMTFSVGGLLLDFVDLAVVQKELDISKISHAEVGIYQLSGQASFENFEVPARAFDSRRCPSWDVIVRVREENEQVFIVACVRQEQVTALSILVLAPEEMVVVNARGDFYGILNSLVKGTTQRNESGNAALALEI